MSTPVPQIDPSGGAAPVVEGSPTGAQDGPSPAATGFDSDPLAAARSSDGIYQRLPDPVGQPAERAHRLVFHPVGLSKVLVLYFSTLGFYSMFWAYRNWRLLQTHTRQSLSPFWRSLFGRFWGFVLFREVRDDAVSRGARVAWRGGRLGMLYLATGFAMRLGGPWVLINYAGIIPVLVVQHTINQAARTAGVEPDRVYRGVHVPFIAIGPVLMAGLVYGLFFPE